MELRVKVWIRLENILKLQKFLVHHYDQFPSLPHAYVEERTIGSSMNWDSSGAGTSAGAQFAAQARGEKLASKPGPSGAGKSKPKAASKKGSSGTGGGGKKKKARTEPVHNLDSGGEEEQGNNGGEEAAGGSGGGGARSAMKKGKVNLVDEIQPKQILCHLRRLDPRVFEELLQKPINCSGKGVDHTEILMDLSAVSQNPRRLEKIEQFSPETLALLLLELKRQVGGGQLEILSVKRLLKNVCGLVNQIQTALLEKEEESHPGAEGDDSMTEGALLTPNQIKLESCLKLLIGVMTDYLEAIKKKDKTEKELWIQKSIRTFVRQNRDGDEEGGSQIQAMANVATYLGTFVSIIRDSATALDHIKLLKILHDLLEGNKEIKKAISGAAKTYLQNDWKLPSAQVDGFLKIWLATCLSPMKVIKNLAGRLLRKVDDQDEKKKKQKDRQVQVQVNVESEEDEGPEDRGKKKEDFFIGDYYKSCQSTNFHTWYAAMFYGLSQYCYKNVSFKWFNLLKKLSHCSY